jgi:biotin operon repressor
MPGTAERLEIDAYSRGELQTIVESAKTPPRKKLRAKICLMAAEGVSGRQIARTLKTSRTTVSRCWQRVKNYSIGYLFAIAPHGPSHRRIKPALRRRIIDATLKALGKRQGRRKPLGKVRCSTRVLGRRFGISHMTIARIWRESGLDPQSRILRKREIRRDCCYLVGVSPQKALAVGLARGVSRELVQARKALTYRPPLVHGFHWSLQLFDVSSPLQPKSTELYSFLAQLDRRAHPKFILHVLCDSQLEPPSKSILRLVERSKRLQLHFAPAGQQWFRFVENWLDDLYVERFRIEDFYPLIERMKTYGPKPLRPLQSLVLVK